MQEASNQKDESRSLMSQALQMPFYGSENRTNRETRQDHLNDHQKIKNSLPTAIPVTLFVLSSVLRFYSWTDLDKCHASDNQFAETCSQQKQQFIAMSGLLGLTAIAMLIGLWRKVANSVQTNLRESEQPNQESPEIVIQP